MRIVGVLIVVVSMFTFSSCKDHCENGKQDKDENGVDCGGLDCVPCESCFDGILNQGEEKVDCGGPCDPCKLEWTKVKSDGNRLEAIDFNDGLAVAVGVSGSVFKSLDSGKTWTQLNSGVTLDLTSVSVVNRNQFYISGKGDLILKSDDGSTLSSQSTGAGEDWNDIHFVHPDTGMVCGTDMKIYRTVDGGKNWSIAYEKRGFRSKFMSFHFLNEKEGYALSDFDLMYTLNAGRTWILDNAFQTTAEFKDFSDIYFRTTTDAYCVSDNGIFLFIPLAQQGEQWVNKQVKTSGGKLDFLNDDGVYAGRNDGKSQGKVLISSDGGVRWEEENVDKSIEYTDGCVISKDLMVVVGDQGTILRRAK